MTAPVVKHGRDRVTVHLPDRVLDGALTALARALYADSDEGPAAAALLALGEADLIASAPAAVRDAWALGTLHDADVRAANALAVLRDAAGGLVLGLSPDACWELITSLMAHVAAVQGSGRAA